MNLGKSVRNHTPAMLWSHVFYWVYLLCGRRIMQKRMCTLRVPSDALLGIVQARADALRAWEHHMISPIGPT